MSALREDWHAIRGSHAPEFILDWMDDAVERVGPWRDWPAWVRDAVKSRRLDNRHRFKVFLFFLRNGVDPDGAADLVRRACWTDDAARRQLIWLAEHHLLVLHRYSDARVWDVNNQRVERY